jgi:hypothetical protein
MPRIYDIMDRAYEDGQMLYFYNGEWHLLPPGNRGDRLISGGPGSYPGWGTPGPLPSSSSSSEEPIPPPSSSSSSEEPIPPPSSSSSSEFIDQGMFATDSLPNSNLYEVDPVTGARTLVGPTGFAYVRGMCFDPTSNILYGICGIGGVNVGDLITINPTTGQGFIVGATGLTDPASIMIDGTGQMYATTGTGDGYSYFAVNKNTAVVAPIIPLMGFDGQGVCWQVSGQAWYSNNFLAGAGTPPGDLYSIIPPSGATTYIGSHNKNPIKDMTEYNNQVYGVVEDFGIPGNGTLALVNTATGNATLIGGSQSWLALAASFAGVTPPSSSSSSEEPIPPEPSSSSSSSSSELEPIPPVTEDCLLEGCWNVTPTSIGQDCASCWFNLVVLLGGIDCVTHCVNMGMTPCNPEWYCFWNGMDWECGCCCIEELPSSSSSSSSSSSAPPLQQTMYVTDNSGALYTINPTTGGRTHIGGTGWFAVRGMAFDPTDGTLYGVALYGDLITINTSTGLGTLVGNTGVPNPASITFDAAGNLYMTSGGAVMGGTPYEYYSVNKTTAAATPITVLFPAKGQGVCTQTNGNSWYSTDDSAGSGIPYVAPFTLVNGAVGPSVAQAKLRDMTEYGGQVYGVDAITAGQGQLQHINTTTGVVTNIGPIQDIMAIAAW